MDKKEVAIEALDDLVNDFLYFDRIGDRSLDEDDMRELIDSKELSYDDIVKTFKTKLKEAIEEHFPGVRI